MVDSDKNNSWSIGPNFFKLPETVYTHSILRNIAMIDEFKGYWRWVAEYRPELFEAEKEKLDNDPQNNTKREFLANANSAAGDVVTHDLICSLHQKIMESQKDNIPESGVYRSWPVKIMRTSKQESKIEKNIILQPPPAEVVQQLMSGLIEGFNTNWNEKSKHPLILIAIFVAAFSTIHPFLDGNGRLCRFLQNLFLLRAGYSYTPYSPLAEIIWRDTLGYNDKLRECQKTLWDKSPNWTPWLECAVDTYKQQMTEASKLLMR